MCDQSENFRDVFVLRGRWLCESLSKLSTQTSFLNHDKFLQFLGELAVLSLILAKPHSLNGKVANHITEIFCSLVDHYRQNYPYRTDPKLYRLTCLLSHTVTQESVRRDLRVSPLRQLAVAQFFSKERTPWEIFTIKFSENPLNISPTDFLPSEQDLISTSLIGFDCPPQMLSREGYYAITHIVFFATRFGNIEPSIVFSKPERTILRLKELLCYMQLGDEADISSELILSLLCMKASWGDIRHSYQLLLQKFENETLDGENSSDHVESEEFWKKYHTLLVILMISAMGCRDD